MPAKKNTAPRIEYTIIVLTLLAPPPVFIKLTAARMRPTTPKRERMIPRIRFSMGSVFEGLYKLHALPLACGFEKIQLKRMVGNQSLIKYFLNRFLNMSNILNNYLI
jgi:hypothetical protein